MKYVLLSQTTLTFSCSWCISSMLDVLAIALYSWNLHYAIEAPLILTCLPWETAPLSQVFLLHMRSVDVTQWLCISGSARWKPSRLSKQETYIYIYIYTYIHTYIVVVNFDALVQVSDTRIERRQVVFLCWMQDSNPSGSQTPNRQQTECSLTNRLGYRGSS